MNSKTILVLLLIVLLLSAGFEVSVNNIAPVTTTILMNLLLLSVAYIIIEKIVSNKENKRWDAIANDIVIGVKEHADKIDREVFQLVRRHVSAHKIKGATSSSPREDKNKLVETYLVEALTDKETLITGRTLWLLEPDGLTDIMNELSDTIRFSSAALASNRKFHPMIDLLPELKSSSSVLSRKIKKAVREAQNKNECSAETTEEVLSAWKEYENNRQSLSAYAVPFIKESKP